MRFGKFGTRSLNLDNVAHMEEQNWHDCSTMKVHFVGQGNTPPLLLTQEEANKLAAYLDCVAEQPLTVG